LGKFNNKREISMGKEFKNLEVVKKARKKLLKKIKKSFNVSDVL